VGFAQKPGGLELENRYNPKHIMKLTKLKESRKNGNSALGKKGGSAWAAKKLEAVRVVKRRGPECLTLIRVVVLEDGKGEKKNTHSFEKEWSYEGEPSPETY